MVILGVFAAPPNSEQFYPETVSNPIGQGLSPTRPAVPTPPPISETNNKSRLSSVLLCIISGLITLLEKFTELRKTAYPLDNQFIIKEYNSGTARGERCTGQSMGKRCGASMLSLGALFTQDLQVFTNPEISEPMLLGFYGGFIT